MKTRLTRWAFNWFPAFRGTGGRITYIRHDWREVRVKIPLGWRTRNYVGTTYGGSMYGAVDPLYMVMLIKLLGPDYVVWDKAATIQFLRPGRGTLYAEFFVNGEELDAIRELAEQHGKLERQYTIEIVDGEGIAHATVQKTIHVRRRIE